MAANMRIELLRKNLSHAFAVGFVVSAVLIATCAEARLRSSGLSPLTQAAQRAVHLPTGCIAHVRLDGREIVDAAITDPDCLPDGTTERTVSERRIDFELISPPPTR